MGYLESLEYLVCPLSVHFWYFVNVSVKLFTHLPLWMALFHQCFVTLDIYFEKLHNK